MYTKLYIVKDIVAETTIGQIVRSRNDAVARRTFSEAMTDKESPFAKNPQDFILVAIGEMDEATGIIEAYTTPDVVDEGTNYTKETK